MVIAIAAFLMVLALGGGAYVFAGAGRERQQKRLAAVTKQTAQLRGMKGGDDTNAIKRKNVQQLLKQIESKTAEQKQRITTRRRLDMAGWADVSTNVFWAVSAGFGAAVGLICFLTGQQWFVIAPAAFAAAFGLPRWVLAFKKSRREKKFTGEFAN